MPNRQRGFASIIILIIVLILIILGVLFLISSKPKTSSLIGETLWKAKEDTAQKSQAITNPLQEQKECPEPFVFQLPIDIDKATSVLYPGQVRGEDYKAHGGFRFDGSKNDEIVVKAPYDAYVIA